MEPGVVSRNKNTMPNNNKSRAAEYGGVSVNGGENDRPSHSALGQGFGNTTSGWGGSIWNNSLGPTFGSTARDTSRPRDNGGYIGSTSDAFEGKTGSGSLVASSESDNWSIHRSPWGASDANTTSLPHARSSGVSPARKRTAAQPPPSQSYADSSSSPYYQVSRGPALGQSAVPKPTKPLLDPTTMNFSSNRQIEPMTNGFSSYGRFGESDMPTQRAEPTSGSWHDADSLHSPHDDRRSIAASEYFGPSSNAPSRSGSLPPSRHGAEPANFAQSSDPYSRFPQPSRGNPSSFSQVNGRAYQERSGSMQSDSLSMFGRLSIDHEADPALMVHKPSSLVRSEDGGFTPENYTHGQVNDHAAQLRSFQFDSRSAPNGTGVRQTSTHTPFYSNTHTPPVYDHLYPSRTDPQAPHVISNGNISLVERKLRGLRMQQEQQNFNIPQNFQQQHFQHMLAANQFRGPYNAYPYGMPNGMHVGAMTPNMTVPGVHGMIPMIEPPKAPRDHEGGDGYRSAVLQEFKSNSKTSKRYELKDIYDYVVEFSGDQHGSRFIQQKLETANSDEKDRLFKEIQAESLQLMQDVFGNYVIQKFFEHGDQSQKRILANRMKGHILNLSLQMYGCRVVQKALEHILTDQQASMVKELEKDVLRCVKDQNGNHVIQKAIERVPPEHISFIIQAFRGNVGGLATHPYGCRVIQRMLEHCEEGPRTFILQELHAEGARLISDQYGNYVTQHVIEHGNPEDRAKIIGLVKAQLLIFSKHKFASNVVEKCLVFGTDEQRREIMLKVVEKTDRGESTLMMLIKDGYGNYVIQKILDTLSPKDYAEFVDVLQPEMAKAKKVISGKQVLSVEKKMHRFERYDSVSDTGHQRNSLSSTTVSTDISTAATPPLSTSGAQSPQSGSLPSINNGTVDEPVQKPPVDNKTYPTTPAIGITNSS